MASDMSKAPFTISQPHMASQPKDSTIDQYGTSYDDSTQLKGQDNEKTDLTDNAEKKSSNCGKTCCDILQCCACVLQCLQACCVLLECLSACR